MSRDLAPRLLGMPGTRRVRYERGGGTVNDLSVTLRTRTGRIRECYRTHCRRDAVAAIEWLAYDDENLDVVCAVHAETVGVHGILRPMRYGS